MNSTAAAFVVYGVVFNVNIIVYDFFIVAACYRFMVQSSGK
jgi:hypothetical protein